MSATIDESPAKRDARLLSLAAAYRTSKSADARNMMRGKAWKLVGQFYSVPANRKAVWAEWCVLADPDPNGWLRRGT
jgi:hypothetical protein